MAARTLASKIALDVDPITSARMALVRQRGTAPELRVRELLREHGVYYRTANRDLPGSPDVANRRHRWAVFVHGCFWHGHRRCSKATVPKRNREFWMQKLDANRKRDRRALKALIAMGFSTLVVWQCELENGRATRKLAEFLRGTSL